LFSTFSHIAQKSVCKNKKKISHAGTSAKKYPKNAGNTAKTYIFANKEPNKETQ
jgi:hypothetical protein